MMASRTEKNNEGVLPNPSLTSNMTTEKFELAEADETIWFTVWAT